MAPVVRIVSFEVWGAVGRIEALFAGELCLRKIISAAPDSDTCLEEMGRLKTGLFVE